MVEIVNNGVYTSHAQPVIRQIIKNYKLMEPRAVRRADLIVFFEKKRW
jgi:hypothetical protein